MKITYKEYQEFWAALDAVPGHEDKFRELAKQHGWKVCGG